MSAYDTQVLADSPVLFVAGGTAADATSKHTVTAFSTPATSSTPNGDSCFVFNGINQYLEVSLTGADLSVSSNGFTVEAWIRPDVLQFPTWEASGYVHWMGKGTLYGTVGNQEWLCRMYNFTNSELRPNRISGYAFRPAGGSGVGSYFQDTVVAGEWIHYALVINPTPTTGTDSNGYSYDFGYTKVYKNGVLRDQDALDNTVIGLIQPQPGGAPVRVGTEDFNSYFQGAIAKIAIYPTELSSTRIAAHFAAMVPLQGSITDTSTGQIGVTGIVHESAGTATGTTDQATGTIGVTGAGQDTYFVGRGTGPIDTAAGQILLTGVGQDTYSVGPITPPPVSPPTIPIGTVKMAKPIPPTRLSISVTTPKGKNFRWGWDEPSAKNIPQGIRCSSIAPGGFESLDVTLPRNPRIDYPDLEPLSTLQAIGSGGEIVWEGRIQGISAASGAQQALSVSAVGWQSHLQDNEACSVIFIDRNLSSWGDTSTQRKEDLTNASFAPGQGSSTVNPGVPAELQLQITALHQEYPGTAARPVAISEVFYQAGPGNNIQQIRGDFTSHNLGPGWAIGLYVYDPATGQYYNDSPMTPLNDTASTSRSPSQTITVHSPDLTGWTAALAQMYFTAKWDQDAEWDLFFDNLRVLGAPGVPIVNLPGGSSQTEGVHASDALLYIIKNFCPLLYADATTIEPSSYVIPQLRFDGVSPGDMVNGCIAFGVPAFPDWYVWEHRRFYVYSRINNTVSWPIKGAPNRQWYARIGPSQLSETGPDLTQLWNQVMISYSDVDGSNKTVGPPGSGADYQDASLNDPDPSNPLNQFGLVRCHNLSMGITSTKDIAIAIGQTFLGEAKLISRAGQATHQGTIESANTGALCPAYQIRAGDQIAYVDASDPTPRRVVHVDYDDDSRVATVSLDAPPDAMAGLLARLGVQIASIGLG